MTVKGDKLNLTVTADNVDDALIKLRDTVKATRGVSPNMIANAAVYEFFLHFGINLKMRFKSERQEKMFRAVLDDLRKQESIKGHAPAQKLDQGAMG